VCASSERGFFYGQVTTVIEIDCTTIDFGWAESTTLKVAVNVPVVGALPVKSPVYGSKLIPTQLGAALKARGGIPPVVVV